MVAVFSDPEFIKSFVPLIVALIAFGGVSWTIIANDKRARTDSRVKREDEYRTEMRAVISKLLSEIEEFSRDGVAFSDIQTWIRWENDDIRELKRACEIGMRSVRVNLMTALLLAQEDGLSAQIEELSVAVDNASSVIHEVVIAYTEGRHPDKKIMQKREKVWETCYKKSANLRDFARETLKPTVRQSRMNIISQN